MKGTAATAARLLARRRSMTPTSIKTSSVTTARRSSGPKAGPVTAGTKHTRLTIEDIREALVQRNADHETEFYVLVTPAQAGDLAAGYVPTAVKAQIRTMLEWQREDQRKAIAADASRDRRPQLGSAVRT